MTKSKKTLLLQFRKDKDALVHERKAFEQMGGYKKGELVCIDILGGAKIPETKEVVKYKSAISGGAPHREIDPIVEKKLTNLYKALIKHEIPTLAICYANQSMAVSLGGKLDTAGTYAETGTVKITLTREGKRSMLFRNLPENFFAVVGHKVAVTKLPRGATHLAYSKRTKYQSFRLGENFFGLQFHPELDKDDLLWRLQKYPEFLNGKSVTQVKRDFKHTLHTIKILQNFRLLEEL